MKSHSLSSSPLTDVQPQAGLETAECGLERATRSTETLSGQSDSRQRASVAAPQGRTGQDIDVPILKGYGPLQTDADYYALLTRKIFHAGFNRDAVDRRWSAFERAFRGFQPEVVARFAGSDIDRVLCDTSLIQNRRKLLASLRNAQRIQAIAKEHGSFHQWLIALSSAPYEYRAESVAGVFAYVGEMTAFGFLFEAGLASLDERPEAASH